MSSNDLAPKVISRTRPREARWPTASVKVPPSDLTLIDAAAGLLTQRNGMVVTRSDVIYSGVMHYVRYVLNLPEAA